MSKLQTGKREATLGRKVTKFEGFDTFPTPKGIREVTCVSDEVTSNCPVTGQPDQYTVKITYYPNKRCVESKTLKMFFQSFRNKGLFVEKFASVVAHAIMEALDPFHVEVAITQKARGGVSIIAQAALHRTCNPSEEQEQF